MPHCAWQKCGSEQTVISLASLEYFVWFGFISAAWAKVRVMQKIDPKLCTEILVMQGIRYAASSTDKSIFTAKWIRPSFVKYKAWGF